MTKEQQRIKIAEACGWTMPKYSKSFGDPDDYIARIEPDGSWIEGPLPDYLNDLNACHEMEDVLDDFQRIHFSTHIMHLHNAKGGRGCSPFDYGHADAPQRCEAFLRTLGKWEES